LNTETLRGKQWLVNLGFGVLGYALLMFVATGQLGFLSVFRLLDRGDWDAGGMSLVALTLLYAGWLTSFREDKARCLGLCLACLVFLAQTALTHWHAIVLLPLVCYLLATMYLVLTWLDTGSLDD
jgi:hypothetical protein